MVCDITCECDEINMLTSIHFLEKFKNMIDERYG